MDQRLQQLTTWLSEQLDDNTLQITPVSGDASFRRYFRVEQREAKRDTTERPTQWIAMDAPPEKEDSKPFVAIARHWSAQGIEVPHIEAFDLAQGFMLLADFGDMLMLKELDPRNTGSLDSIAAATNGTDTLACTRYQSALEALSHIQQCSPPEHYTLPPYDHALLSREMELFREWLVGKALGIDLTPEENTLLDSTFQLLIDEALSQPHVCVHRDYHSRNLMILEDQSIGILDFQDAVIGPITYDAVSLLRDCYISLPDQFIEARLDEFHQATAAAGLHSAPKEQFTQWFDLMGVQRHLKAAGIFARLSLRDGKHSYLNDIPRAVNYIEHVTRRYPQLQPFTNWLSTLIVPDLKQKLTAHNRSSSKQHSETG